ncbi:MAG: acyl--CoA ligase [Rhodocyclaceae bacterium]|nr:acyl--CoA ligase [Rhodocyclaceae bacterium]MBX3677957.1 acyl--CoA ligase [Rhodocyclaceae bacterium]
MLETITAALARQARERPEALALIAGGVRLTWCEAKDWVDRAAGWLLALGLPRGAPILGWLPNSAEWYLVRWACEQAGLFWIPVPTSQGSRELSSILERVRPAVLLSPGRFRERDYAAECEVMCSALALKPIRLLIQDSTILSLNGPVSDEDTALRLDEMAHALATTGTEGIPKLAIYTLAAACERAHAQTRLLGLTANDTLLVLSAGTGPARAAWLAASVAGSCVVGIPVFGIDVTLKLIEQERPTIVCGTPAQLAMLAPKLKHADISSVRIWYTAGSVLPPTLADEFESATHGIVLSTYGGADFGGWSAADPSDPAIVRHATVGKPRGGTEFRIVDDKGLDVVLGKVGELIGRGPCCVSGYIGTEGSDRWKAGWFYTGDLAWIDKLGHVKIVGRLKEVIVRGGDKVSPADVETVLRTHPGIAQVAVVGVSDPVLGERVCACIVPTHSTRVPTLEELREHSQSEGLAPYKAPERILVLESLPMVGDKIDRRTLVEIASHLSERSQRVAL